MSDSEAEATWDFTPVINLLNSFKAGPQKKSTETLRGCVSKFSEAANDDNLPSKEPEGITRDCCKLGDFSTVWTFLSQPSSSASDDACGSVISRELDGSSDERANEEEGGSVGRGNNVSREPLEATVENHTESGGTQAKKILLRRSNLRLDDSAPLDNPGECVPERPPIQILKNPHLNPVRQASSLRPASPTCPKTNGLAPDDLSTKCNVLNLPKTVSKSPLKSQYQVKPKLTGSAAEKKADLIKLLRECHAEQSLHLANPKICDPAFTSSNTSPNGIHVFVDTSNVMVGFHDRIKIARDIPINARVPRLALSFHNLSLILERGRPVCKRVLVGSDRIPPIDEAEKLGYETNILVRVQKVKEASPRKKKSLCRRDATGTKCNGNAQQEKSSGSETVLKPVPEKWVEQAVDEILHLKMLESIVDTDQPSTAVLVTGDAAEAEYSAGFLKMVERALQKGWTVELVSFSSTISRAYSRAEFKCKWRSKFSIIELDKYAEYLLDM
ncbi:hypothetical protein PRK78_006094 [Emydomyces testavorans]|uniref:NYN domain-containing protein n=1 Tax=Emydomyces testavorans TaxID=2070801 RepID=A0AAF0DMV6_9EURO|nr:hypothetical protein PRK78_006094 [Emydomyces testavorans]